MNGYTEYSMAIYNNVREWNENSRPQEDIPEEVLQI